MAFEYAKYGSDTADFSDGEGTHVCPVCFEGAIQFDLCERCRVWVCYDCFTNDYNDVCLTCVEDD